MLAAMPTEIEIEAVEALIILSQSIRFGLKLPRWGKRKRRSSLNSLPKRHDRLSPSTPLSFFPSAVDPPPPPPPLPPPPPPPAFLSLQPWPSLSRQLVKEQHQRIASLSSTRSILQQSVLEARNQHQILRERNRWLKELKAKALGPFHVVPTSGQMAAAEWRRAAEEEGRRAAAYAAARRRRIELQRVKASLRIQRLR